MNEETSGTGRHIPVLLGPVLEGLNVRVDGQYVDGTFGRGGHSRGILERLGAHGRLLAVDRDPQAIAEAPQDLVTDPRFRLVRGEIAKLEDIAMEANILGGVDGILFDLGVSSPQLDESERGFSFRSDGPLDMRMDPDSGRSAAAWLRTVDEKELRRVLRVYGEERHANRIAAAICAQRATTPIETTRALASIVEGAVQRRGARIHPATKTFQAIRIVINDELGQLKQALAAALAVLRSGGRLCVISFHSLEDRIVKRFMRDASRESEAYRGMPNVPADQLPPLRLIGKAVSAGDAEAEINPRSRSARLRIAERCR